MGAHDAPDPFGRRAIALRDGASTANGLALAIGVHLLVVLFAMRAGSNEGNIAHATNRGEMHDEEIIEGALLRQGGGGDFDPRNIPHRVAPVRAEERAAPTDGLAHADPNAVVSDAGARPRRDPNALATDRDIAGQGNQDLAERLARLAASENTNAVPNAPPGPGSPDGSINGTETDPNRAGHGAQAKIRSFLEHNLHVLNTAPPNAHFRLRIIISDDGSYVAHGEILQGSGDDTTDSDLASQLERLGQDQTPIPELTDEEKSAIAGHPYAVRYPP